MFKNFSIRTFKKYLLVFSLIIASCLTTVLAQDAINFNPKRGFYNSAFQVTLTTNLTGATIRYTTNGTAPTTSTGTIYSGPVSVNTTSCIRAIAYNGSSTSIVITHTYIFLDQVIQQPATIPGWPNTTYNTGQGNAVHDYEMDPDIVNSLLYKDSIKTALLSIPTMSIVMDKNQFWESYDASTDTDIENPASVEVIYPNDSSLSEHVNCGLEGHSHKRLKRSLRLKFKSEYGFSNFNTQLLREGPVNGTTAGTAIDNLVLRAGNNRSWARTWNPDRTCYTRDEWYRQSQVEASGFGSHGNFVHLYVNGLYWGLYNTVERPDDNFSSLYFGGSDSDWFAVNHDGNKDGDPARYSYLLDVVIKKDLRIAANYEEFKNYLDVNDFCDYMIVTWMTGMTDWPGNNFWGGNRNSPPGPFHYYGWDCEWSWDVTNGSNEGAWVHPNFRKNQTTGAPIAAIWNAAKKNPEFMMAFADRVNKQCFGNGPLTDVNSLKRWTDLNNFIKVAIIAESARWGDALNDGVTRTRNGHWQPEVTRLNNLINGNVNRFINALLVEGYYPTINAPLFSSPGGEVSKGFQLSISNPNSGGTIYYTLNDVDPRDADGNPSSSSVIYSGPITVNCTITIKARIKNGTLWSALTEEKYTIEGTTLVAFDLNTGNYEFNSWADTNAIGTYPPHMQFVRASAGVQDPVLSEPMEELYFHVYNATSQSRINGLETDGFSFINTGTSGNLGAALLALKTTGRKNIHAEFVAGTVTPNFRLYAIRLKYKIGSGMWKDVPGPVEYVRNDTAGHTKSFNINLSALTSEEVNDQELVLLQWKYYFVSGTSGARAQLRIDDIKVSSDPAGPSLMPFDMASGNYSLAQWDASSPAGSYPSNMIFVQAGPAVQDPPLSEPMDDPYIKVYNATSQSRINGLGSDGFSFINTGTSGNLGAAVLALKSQNRKDIIVNWKAGTVTPNVRVYGIRLQYKIGNSGSWTDIPGPIEYIRNDTAGHAKSFSTNISSLTEGAVNNQQLLSLRWKYYFISGASSARAQLRVDDILISSSAVGLPPVVNAGTDKEITLPLDSITLTGSASDPDGTVASYLWNQQSGPSAAVIENGNNAAAKVKNLVEGNYIFRLTATDNSGLSSFDEVAVKINPLPAGHAVISFTLVNSTTDQDIRTLTAMDTINLAAIGTPINIRANSNPSVTGSVVFLLNAAKTTESVSPYALKGDNNGNYNNWNPAPGLYTLSATPYTLSGGKGSAGNPLLIQFRVINQPVGNQSPVANAGMDQTITLPSNTVTLNGSGTDPDGVISSYLWSKISGPSATFGNTSQPSLAVSDMLEGTYVFRLTVTDNSNATGFDETVIHVISSSSVCQVEGTILREYWTGVAGEEVDKIPLHLPPSGSDLLPLFEGPQNWANKYGTRIRGYICPPMTGNYFFWIASNDAGELWLSTDDNPVNKTRIAFVNTYTNYREWTKLASQKSATIHLEAGKRYYIEALQKEGVNSDHISVGWQLPNGTLERPVPGTRLSPFENIHAREAVEPISLFSEIEADTTYEILVYPNPAEKGFITLGISGYTGKTKAGIRILDQAGKEIYSDKASCDRTCSRTIIHIDERFQPGTYIIYVEIENKVYQQKLIVK